MPQNIVLVSPCYNAPADFVETFGLYFQNLKAFFPDRQMNLFVVNEK
jgi:hypothetical protein